MSSGWQELRSLPRAVWWLAGATLVNRMGAMVFPYLVLYFHRALGYDLTRSTAIVAFYGLGSSVASPLGGYLADRFDCTRVLAAALALSGSLLVLFPSFQGTHALMLATFLLALCSDVARPSTMTAQARLGGPERSRDAFTLNYLAINLGMCIGPTLGGYLATWDYRYLFWVDGGTSLASSLLLLSSGVRCPIVRKSGQATDWKLGRPAFQALGLSVLALWSFMTFFSATPLFMVDWLHLPESRCGLLWLVNTVLIVLTTVQLNHWTRGQRLQQQLCFATLSIAGCYTVLYAYPRVPGLFVAIVLLTIGEMLLFSNSSAYLQRVVPEHKLGRAMGLSAICVSMALSLSSPVIGYFFARHRPDQLWLLMAGLTCLAAVLYARLPDPPVHEKAIPQQQPV